MKKEDELSKAQKDGQVKRVLSEGISGRDDDE